MSDFRSVIGKGAAAGGGPSLNPFELKSVLGNLFGVGTLDGKILKALQKKDQLAKQKGDAAAAKISEAEKARLKTKKGDADKLVFLSVVLGALEVMAANPSFTIDKALTELTMLLTALRSGKVKLDELSDVLVCNATNAGTTQAMVTSLKTAITQAAKTTKA